MISSADIVSVLNDFGQSVTFKSKTEGVYNIATGVQAESSASSTVKVMFYSNSQMDVDGVNTVRGTRKVVIGALDTSGASIPTPKPNDEISGESDDVTILSVDKIIQTGSYLCYLCTVAE